MSLKNYQTALTLSKLYKVNKKAAPNGVGDQLKPSIFIDSGTVDVYIYNGATQPTALADMVLDTSDLDGLENFETIPTYIAIVQNTGTTTELVISCVETEDLGAIA